MSIVSNKENKCIEQHNITTHVAGSQVLKGLQFGNGEFGNVERNKEESEVLRQMESLLTIKITFWFMIIVNNGISAWDIDKISTRR